MTDTNESTDRQSNGVDDDPANGVDGDDQANDTDDCPCGSAGDCSRADAGPGVTRRVLSAGLAGSLLGLAGCIGLEDEFATEPRRPTYSRTPTPLRSPSTESTSTGTATPTPTDEPTATPSEASTETPTPSGTPTPEPTASPTPTYAATDTPWTTETATGDVALLDGSGDRVGVNRLGFGDWLDVRPAATAPDLPPALLLVRYPEEEYARPTDMDALLAGHALYSRVCTHRRCEVDQRLGNRMVCPCHEGTFDPLQGASVLSGPPQEPLEQFELTRDGQTLAVDRTGGE